MDSLRIFCNRIRRVDKVINHIVEDSLKKESEHLDETLNQCDNQSSISEKCRDGHNMIERDAEKFLAVADQKYQSYFTLSGVTHPDKKDTQFKDLYNINHQIIKLLQKSEDRANYESLKSDRNKKVIQEIDMIFRNEGHSDLLKEIKTLNEKILVENDELLEECITLRKQIERTQDQTLRSESVSFYKEQLELLEKKNEILQNKIQNSQMAQMERDDSKEQMKQGNQVLYSRFEETSAALDRAFERISGLEHENNKLIGSIGNEKLEKSKLQSQLEKVCEEQKRMNDLNEKTEMEKVHAKEHLHVNNDHVDRIKQEKVDLERKVKQVTEMKGEMSKILDDERQVYKDSKRLFEDEVKVLKQNLLSKVINLCYYV